MQNDVRNKQKEEEPSKGNLPVAVLVYLHATFMPTFAMTSLELRQLEDRAGFKVFLRHLGVTCVLSAFSGKEG